MVTSRRNGRILHLTLDAPPVNVLDAEMLRGLVTALGCGGEAADETAAVLLSGAGRCFSAGASVAEHRRDRAPAMITALVDACVALEGCPAPVVALVHGPCLGGALELASCCDFVVADPAATFGQPEIRLAFFPPVACARLPRLTGRQNAAWLALTGESVSAERALSLGLVQRILPREAWGEVEEQLAALSTPALRLTKHALRLGAAGAEALPALRELFLGPLYEVEDVEEGIRSFEEKRRPAWKHR